MTDGKLLIEKLLSYAKDNLELSEYDVAVKRNLLLNLFKIKTTDLPQVEETPSLSVLEVELENYVTENELSVLGEEAAFIRFVFGMLLPLPSHINKKFRTLREKFGARAACDYLYGLSVNAGAFTGVEYSQKVEKLFSVEGGDFFVKKDNYVQNVPQAFTDYPKCELCSFAEGYYGSADFGGGALRSVSLDLNGYEWKMRFKEAFSKQREAVVSYFKHGEKPSIGDTLMSMLDYIEYLPEYSCDVAFEDSAFGMSDYHAHFSSGITESPVFNQKPTFSAVSAIYPDVEISVFNRDISALRLQSFNRNTLERLSIDLLEKWQDYCDNGEGIYGRGSDGISLNDSFVTVSYAHDNRYSVGIVFACKKTESGFSDVTDYIFDVEFTREALFGTFVLKNEITPVKSAMTSVLTKKTAISEELFADGEVLCGYEDVLQKIIGENGYFKDAQKADAAINSEIASRIFSMIRKKSAFSAGDDGIRALRRFLSSLDIK